MRTVLLSLFVLGSLVSCKSSGNTVLPNLKFEDFLTQKSVKTCQKKISVEKVIELETTEKSLLSTIRKIMFADGLLFVLDMNENLQVFNNDGKYLRKIGSVGQGPGEYTMFTDFTIDEKNKEVYINTLKKFVVYGFDGEFKREVAMEDDDLQVFTFSNDKLYYIAPDKFFPDDVKNTPLVSVFGKDGKILKNFPAHKLRRKEGMAIYNNIATDNNKAYYKEELGKTLYAIDDSQRLDSLCTLDFGKFSFGEGDFIMSKQFEWGQHYRLQNILPAHDVMIFMLQRGLMDTQLEAFVWEKQQNNLTRFSYKATLGKRKLSILPYAVSGNKFVGVLIDREASMDSGNPALVVFHFE